MNDIYVGDPSLYTLVLLADGMYQVVADCNRSSGSYLVDGSSLSMEPGPTTLVECAPDSLSDEFLNRLGDVATFVMQDGELYLNLKMDAGDLVFVPAGEQAPGDGLVGRVWGWAETVTPVKVEAVEDPTRYTLEFMIDGSFAVVADCNRGLGSYALVDGLLTLEFGPMTAAECSADSLGDRFLKELQVAAIPFFEDGDLYIDLQYDSGTMRFLALP